MPQRRVGHLDLVSRIENRAATVGRVALAGNGLGMIGIPSCISGGIGAATRVCVAA
jgi:protoporphyrinogen oxidase